MSLDRRTVLRAAAVAAVAAGIVNPVTNVLDPGRGPPAQWGYFVGGVLLQLGLIGIYAIQVRESGVPGFLGLLMAFTGRAYFSLPDAPIGGVDATAPLGSMYAVGLVLLAVGSLRAGKLPRWAPAMWILAVIVGLTGELFLVDDPLFAQIGAIAVGLGFIGAGAGVWRHADQGSAIDRQLAAGGEQSAVI